MEIFCHHDPFDFGFLILDFGLGSGAVRRTTPTAPAAALRGRAKPAPIEPGSAKPSPARSPLNPKSKI